MGAVKIAESKRYRDHSSGGLSGCWVCSRFTFENELSTRKVFVCGERVRSAGMGRLQPLTPRGLGEEKNRDPLSVCQESAEKRWLAFGELVTEGLGFIKMYYFGVM